MPQIHAHRQQCNEQTLTYTHLKSIHNLTGPSWVEWYWANSDFRTVGSGYSLPPYPTLHHNSTTMQCIYEELKDWALYSQSWVKWLSHLLLATVKSVNWPPEASSSISRTRNMPHANSKTPNPRPGQQNLEKKIPTSSSRLQCDMEEFYRDQELLSLAKEFHSVS